MLKKIIEQIEQITKTISDNSDKKFFSKTIGRLREKQDTEEDFQSTENVKNIIIKDNHLSQTNMEIDGEKIKVIFGHIYSQEGYTDVYTEYIKLIISEEEYSISEAKENNKELFQKIKKTFREKIQEDINKLYKEKQQQFNNLKY